jgi:hypothetical protein
MLFRHQVYLQGVKTGFASDYQKLLRDLYGQFAAFLLHNRYTSLDQFTKGQLKEFLRKFQKSQKFFYSAYTNRLVEVFKQFLDADLELNLAIADSATGSTPDVKSADKIWPTIISDPIPANGIVLPAFVTGFANNAITKTLALVNQGYANGWTNTETFGKIVGTNDNNFHDGLFAKLTAQHAAMIATAIHHISSEVQAAVMIVIASKYVWTLGIATKHTEICLSRAGNVYTYGEGPLPPAHYGCVSEVVPLLGDATESDIPKSFSNWLSDQPQEIKTFAKNPTALTVEQFVEKSSQIIGE